MSEELENTIENQNEDLYVTVSVHKVNPESDEVRIDVDTNVPPFKEQDENGVDVNPNYTAMRILIYGIVKKLARIHADHEDITEKTIQQMTNAVLDGEEDSISRYIEDHKEELENEMSEEGETPKADE